MEKVPEVSAKANTGGTSDLGRARRVPKWQHRLSLGLVIADTVRESTYAKNLETKCPSNPNKML